MRVGARRGREHKEVRDGVASKGPSHASRGRGRQPSKKKSRTREEKGETTAAYTLGVAGPRGAPGRQSSSTLPRYRNRKGKKEKQLLCHRGHLKTGRAITASTFQERAVKLTERPFAKRTHLPRRVIAGRRRCIRSGFARDRGDV